MGDEETTTSEKRKGFIDWMRGIKRDPLPIMTLILGSGFISVCFYFLGLYCLTVYWTGEPWNLRAILFSPLPIDRLHAAGFGFILFILMSGIALLMGRTLQLIRTNKKMHPQKLPQNIIFILGMSCFLAFFISSSLQAMIYNTLLCAMLGVVLAVVLAQMTHMILNAWIGIGSLFLGTILGAILYFNIANMLMESLMGSVFFFLAIIVYWLLFFVGRQIPIVNTITLQSQVNEGFEVWKKYDITQKFTLLFAISPGVIFGIFLTIAHTAHTIYTIDGDQWLGKPYQTIYFERTMHEEALADSATSNEKGSQLYQEQGFYIGERGGLVTYIDQEGDIIRRKDVVMIQEQPSNAQGSSNE
jgi:hypothetical protein